MDNTASTTEGGAAEQAAPSGPAPKNIILFSDGTGNSSKKLQKTNVWRLYEALDLGDPAREGLPQQIAFYDDGVGNSSIRILALLGGVFGWGLARNVMELYKFLCRNYREGDRIYAVGFSRGAYTIRLLVGFVASMGIARYDSEAQLEFDAQDMWAEFRRGFRANNLLSDIFVEGVRSLRRSAVSIKRRLLGQKRYASGVPESERAGFWIGRIWQRWITDHRLNQVASPYTAEDWSSGTWHGPRIEFVGVFDTVAAYGGPIVEITRAIDDWFWPLSMPDYRLSPRVKMARHALAIDDKRGSFQPLLWDEVFETVNPDYDPVNPRLKQVWFCGMHADVGGGYSDESLCFVPATWMLEEMESVGVHFIGSMRQRIVDYANPHGLMHDSRRGVGAGYRYQPRYIAAWLHRNPGVRDAPHVDPRTGVFRDLVIDRGRYRTQGLLVAPILLHHHAERRIASARDGYAPINMTRFYRVEDAEHRIVDSAANSAIGTDHFKALGTRIRIRRIWYFITMVLLALLVSRPWWNITAWGRQWEAVDRPLWDPQILSSWLQYAMPDWSANYLGQVLSDPYAWGALVVAAGFTALRGSAQEAAMAELARKYWTYRFVPGATKEPELPPLGLLTSRFYDFAYWLRMQRSVQWTLAMFKWRAIPLLLGPAMLFLLFGLISYALFEWFG